MNPLLHRAFVESPAGVLACTVFLTIVPNENSVWRAGGFFREN
jgi:hypothetical protein